MKFRKKSIVIDAEEWFRNGDHSEDGPWDREGKVVRRYRHSERPGSDRCHRHYHSNDRCSALMHDHGWIDTLEGGHVVCPGDWIITGVGGERYPCKPFVFKATYEPMGDS